MKIIITANEAMEKGIWEKLCQKVGINEYAVTEAFMSDDTEIELTELMADELGLFND